MPAIAALQSPVSNPNELLNDNRAAELLGIRPQTLAAWRSNGRYKLPFVRIGRCVRYKRSDLEAFVESRRENGSQLESV